MAVLPRLTYDDLRELPDDGKRYELLAGVLYMSPAPSLRHQSIVTVFVGWLFLAQKAGYGRVFAAPVDVVLDPDTVVQPDVNFVRRERFDILTDANVQGAPDLVIEILSTGTRKRDLGAKRQLYAQFRVPHYWIVDPIGATVDRYRLDERGQYVAEPVLRAGDVLESSLFPEITLPVAMLFA
jgi:Uma2 family endonuclease